VLLDRLNFLWRLVMTGVAFAFIFAGGAVMALTVFPLIGLTTPPGPARRDRSQRFIHHMFSFYVRMLHRLGLLHLEVVGASKLRDAGGRLIVANHPTLLDVVLLMALVPRAQCIVKKELWDSPYLGRVVRGAGYIRNDLEPEALLEACRAVLDEGNSLIVFPEGTRTTPGEPVRFRRGFANIATLLEVEIQLVTITCRPPTLIKGEKWWMIPPHRPRFKVDIGQRLDAKGWFGYEYRSLAARKLVRQIEEYYTEQLANG